MRTRLTRTERRTDILAKARRLISERGFNGTEMEDICLACGISRDGLYHHFQNKRAVLDALVEDEIAQLAEVLKEMDAPTISEILRAGSSHLGNDAGVISGLHSREERLEYLSSLEQALVVHMSDIFGDRFKHLVRPGVDPAHIAELFLMVNAHINRREILQQWTGAEAAGFAATALEALAPFLRTPSDLEQTILELRHKAASS